MLAVLLTAAATAFAAVDPDAPRYDPDSAAGKEYALPLAQAREQAGGEPAGSGDGRAATPDESLFGDGITPARQRESSRPQSATGDGAGERAAGSKPAGGTAGAADPATGDGSAAGPGSSRVQPGVRSSAGSSGVSGVAVGAISGALVVLLAVGLTLLVRRRGSASTPA